VIGRDGQHDATSCDSEANQEVARAKGIFVETRTRKMAKAKETC